MTRILQRWVAIGVLAVTVTAGIHAFEEASCLNCGCDNYLFSEYYHGRVCEPGALFWELCTVFTEFCTQYV